jgi:hypothetical protein
VVRVEWCGGRCHTFDDKPAANTVTDIGLDSRIHNQYASKPSSPSKPECRTVWLPFGTDGKLINNSYPTACGVDVWFAVASARSKIIRKQAKVPIRFKIEFNVNWLPMR